MVSRLEELCGIQIAIEIANKLEFKKEILRLPDLHVDHSLWCERSEPLFENMENKRLPDLHVDHSLWFKTSEPWFENMENKVLDTLKKFPFGLRGKIPIPVVIFCLIQSIEWAKFFNEEFDLPFDYSCSFLRSSFFTSKGILDEEKAAREILKDTELSPSLKFCIACHYCLSDVIPVLWEQLPEDKRPKVENEVYCNYFCIDGRNEMADLWSYFLLGELQIIMEETDDSFSLYKFKETFEALSSRDCSDVAFKNCFEELHESEKEEALIFARKKFNNFLSDFEAVNYYESDRHPILFPLQLYLPYQKYLEIAIFFLHYLDQRLLMLFFQPLTLYYVLFHLLSWPYQRMLMDIVSQFWEVLPKTGFCLLLHRLVSLMKHKPSSEFCDYHNILRDFWIQSSSSLKRFFFRFEGIYKEDLLSAFTNEERDDYFISTLHSDFEELNFSYVTYELFEGKFTIEDEKIIRLIFSSATLEEKSDIVRLHGNWFCTLFFRTCDLRRVDLFIECCVPIGRIESFKKELFNDDEIKEVLFNSIFLSVEEEFKKILNWAFSAEEIKEWLLKNFLLYVREEWKCELYTCKILKCFDKILEWAALSSSEIQNFKKSFVLDDGDFARHFKPSLSEGDFEDINFFLEWVFSSSEMEMVKFKKDLAFEMVRHMNESFLSNDLSSLKKLIEWSALSEEEGKDFRRQLAFSEKVIHYYRNLVTEKQLYEVHIFIRWAELTETEVKNFIKLVDKHDNKSEVRPKRNLDSNSTEAKRGRHC